MIDYPEGEPCWAPGAASYLASILKGDEVGWEWGGGASSIWLAPKIKHLHVMESDRKWAELVIQKTDSRRCSVHHHDRGSLYYRGKFLAIHLKPTLWLIDGYRRIDCLKVVEREATEGDIVVCDDALDYAEHLLYKVEFIHRFSMPHPHAGLPCVSAKNTRDRNTVRTHAPATKETFIWQV